jgi:hypothetical protein
LLLLLLLLFLLLFLLLLIFPASLHEARSDPQVDQLDLVRL